MLAGNKHGDTCFKLLSREEVTETVWITVIYSICMLTNQYYGVEPLRTHKFCSYSRSSQQLMGSEGSLPCSPEPSNGPCPISLTSIIILPSHLRLPLPSSLFPCDFPTKTLYVLLSVPVRASYLAHLIRPNLIIVIMCYHAGLG